MLLLDAQTTNTDGSQTTLPCTGGTLLVQIAGTFDGATVTLEGEIEGLGYVALSDDAGTVFSASANTIIVVTTCKAGLNVRAALTGAGASTSVSVAVL